MSSQPRWHAALWLAALVVALPGARAEQSPHIGYLYPAGGQRGTVARITVGGQYLAGARQVYVSGAGVRATVVKHSRALSGCTLNSLLDKLSEAAALQRRRYEAAEEGDTKQAGILGLLIAKTHEEFEMLALKAGLDDPTPSGLATLRRRLSDPRRQPNAQIDETVILRVALARDAPLGQRELRLVTPGGVTNPLYLQVSQFREYLETEPNDRTPDNAVLTARVGSTEPSRPELPSRIPDGKLAAGDIEVPSFDLPNLETLPVVINGQILPGDVDRFRFEVPKGTRLVAAVSARSLVPYLADAVPGWFQATLRLLDPKGNELAFSDDFRFLPDPVVYFEVPKDGEYILEIADSIYRGREDFVYRITVGQIPFVTHVFPLGGRAGDTLRAALSGWNLPTKQLLLDTQPGAPPVRRAVLDFAGPQSNEVAYAVDSFPESAETEPNDTPATAQSLVLPHVVNGRIGRPGDVDVFRLQGHAGDQVVAEVQARRLYSPLDSLLRLTDESGQIIAWNDDYVLKDGDLYRDLGVITHHADSYLLARLPKDGTYYVRLCDTQNHGSDAHAYRLRISPPQPDVELYLNPSNLTVPAEGRTSFTVDALRKDGFQGEIVLALKGAPGGFALEGARIPCGCDRVRVALVGPRQASGRPLALCLEGRTEIGGAAVTRPVLPADDVMQAFLWRHLVGTRDWFVTVSGRGSGVALKPVGDEPVKLPAGGAAPARVSVPKGLPPEQMRFELDEPPKGIAIKELTPGPDGVAIVLCAAAEAKPGLKGNLIVKAFRETVPEATEGEPKPAPRRTPLGMLPPIPFEIVPGPPAAAPAPKPEAK